MATAVTDDNYLQQIHTARTELLSCFRRAHELLTEREAHLLMKLEAIQNDYEVETKSQQEDLLGLEESKQVLKKNLRDHDILNEALAAINRKIKQILKLSSEAAHTISFKWNTDLDRDLQHAGEVITSSTSQPVNLTPVIPQPTIPDYKNKSFPIITCCKHKEGKSISPSELYWPHGIAIEPQSEIIYIADTGNDRVLAYTPKGEYSFMFSRNMDKPWGICINNNSVYVSQWWGVALYKLDGAYVDKVGSRGTRNGQFMDPRGLAVSPTTGHLYVCDRNRVQIFDKDLIFLEIFGNNVNHPMDIKLTNELIIVLDKGNPCMHIFSISDNSLLNSIISRGTGEHISYSLFFTMDAELNLLLADYDKHCVKIFSLTGEFIAKIGKVGQDAGKFINPTGIVIDRQNRIIVVSKNDNTSLQIFCT